MVNVIKKPASKEEMAKITKNEENPPSRLLVVSGDRCRLASLFDVATIVGHFTGTIFRSYSQKWILQETLES